MSPFDESRVVQVFAPIGATGKGRKGAGYLVRNDLVLTAGHVVADATGSCEVRRFATEGWLTTNIAWPGGEGLDAVLLRVEGGDADAGHLVPVRLGRFATSDRASCDAVGFPWAQLDEREQYPVRRTERLQGKVDPLSGLDPILGQGLLAVHAEGAVPSPRTAGGSPWEGMSGAALFCGELLVGVIVVDPKRFGTDRLAAIPAAALAGAAGFCAQLAGEDKDSPATLPVEAVEDLPARRLLAPPYLPLPDRAPPSLLLRAAFGVVPFRGRHRELRELHSWCATDAPIGLTLWTALGGTGKSRLAAELCQRVATETGWVAGFLRPKTRGDQLRVVTTAVSPLLLVVDYAETRADQVAELLEFFTEVESSRAPVRLIFIARGAGDWWKTLPHHLRDPRAEAVVLGAEVRNLEPSEVGASTREESFWEAARAFAPYTSKTPLERVHKPDLSLAVYSRFLFVQLAALNALEGDRDEPADLRTAVLEREARVWEDTWRAYGLPLLGEQVRRRAIAVATLTPSLDVAEGVAALSALPELASDSTLRLRVAAWLRELYPGPGYLNPLEPDLLGEALVAQVLGDLPTLPVELSRATA